MTIPKSQKEKSKELQLHGQGSKNREGRGISQMLLEDTSLVSRLPPTSSVANLAALRSPTYLIMHRSPISSMISTAFSSSSLVWEAEMQILIRLRHSAVAGNPTRTTARFLSRHILDSAGIFAA